jgi:hypothetical protein
MKLQGGNSINSAKAIYFQFYADKRYTESFRIKTTVKREISYENSRLVRFCSKFHYCYCILLIAEGRPQ